MLQTALITGASQGIGAAIAIELARQNIHTVLLARNPVKLGAVAARINDNGGSCSYYDCDITSHTAIEQTLAAVEKELTVLPSILINNAGLGGPFHHTDEVTPEEWDLIFATNVKAPFLFCKKFLPAMKQQQFGRIINISSIYGIVGGARSSTYAASKHALAGYTKSLAVEWGKYNITCNIISPGYINTSSNNSAGTSYLSNVLAHIPGNKQGVPADIAKLVYFLTQPASNYINGADIVVDGGMLAGFNF